MSKLYSSQTSSTFSSVLIAAGLIAHPYPTFAKGGATIYKKNVLQGTYSAKGNVSTYNSMRGIVTGHYDSNTKNFEQSVGDFYEKLLAHQEPLGADFKKVLYENLWDLYES